jgi:hypothetical protein
MQPTTVTVTDIDHLVLECADVRSRSRLVPRSGLGLAPVRVDEWRAGTVPFRRFRVTDHTIIDLNPQVPRRLDDSTILPGRRSDRPRRSRGQRRVRGGRGAGTRGSAPAAWGPSLYVRDPDGTVVELRYYV